MKNILVLGGAGVGLFIGSVVGLLAATGRLNHEGTQGIPVLSMLFPAPEPGPGDGPDGQGATGAGSQDPAGAGQGDELTPGEGDDRDTQDASQHVIGKSAFGGDAEKGGGHGGGAAVDGDGEGERQEPPTIEKVHPKEGESPEETDNRRVLESIYHDYGGGQYFTFEPIRPRISVEEINQILSNARDAEERIQAEDQRLQQWAAELQERERDVAARQDELAREMQELEALQATLDARIAQFEAEVDIVRNAERKNLQELAKSLSSLEPVMAAGFLEKQWATEVGRSRVVKLLRTMKPSDADDILAAMNADLRVDVLEARLKLAEEPPAAEPGGRR